jgi:hypothetical protein
MATKTRELSDLILRALDGSATGAECDFLRRAVLARRILLSTGDGSAAIGGDAVGGVAVGGDVSRSAIVTGDHNTLINISGIDPAALRKLILDLQLPRAGSAPPLPGLFVGRDADMMNIKARLGIAVTPAAPPSLQVLAAVRGWPGIGKTTLAAALAHDEDVNAAYPDGVLWVSLGTEPNIMSELAGWGRALGNDDLLRASTITEASAQLAAMLRNRRMLLIVDDVWDKDHVKPFQVGGRGCAMLVTTRASDVAQAVAPTAGSIYRLPVLHDDAAMEILRALAPGVVAKHPAECMELIHELEGLPLALQVSGHMLNAESNRGFGVVDLLADLREGAKVLEAQAPAERIGLASESSVTVAVLLKKSTDRLDAFTRDCFAYLGPFAPKPATFDLGAMKFVWQVDDPKPIAVTLIGRGLLEPVGDTGRFQMHALLVAHAKSLLTDD